MSIFWIFARIKRRNCLQQKKQIKLGVIALIFLIYDFDYYQNVGNWAIFTEKGAFLAKSRLFDYFNEENAIFNQANTQKFDIYLLSAIYGISFKERAKNPPNFVK